MSIEAYKETATDILKNLTCRSVKRAAMMVLQEGYREYTASTPYATPTNSMTVLAHFDGLDVTIEYRNYKTATGEIVTREEFLAEIVDNIKKLTG